MKKQDEFTFSPVRETLEKQAKKLISRRKTNKKDLEHTKQLAHTNASVDKNMFSKEK